MIAVLATCFNRRDVTLAGLRRLPGAFGDVPYRVYLVDDGSTDGTGDAVRAGFPDVVVVPGDGSLYWNGGMRRAWQAALADRPEYVLWWNDDLELLPDSLADLYAEHRAAVLRHGERVISVGSIIDPDTGAPTYGAYVRGAGRSRLRFVRPGDAAGVGEPVTMNGNCVLVPAVAAREIGILSDRYRHSTGDVDYGLRASAAGYRIVPSRRPVGHAKANKTLYSDRDAHITWRQARALLTDPKGVPWREWLYFCRSHGGALWPVNFLYRYLRIFGVVR